jgi:hypothetical protein
MLANSARLMVCEGRGHQNFDAGVRGGVGGGCSEGGVASLLGAVRVYEVSPVPSKFSSRGGVC